MATLLKLSVISAFMVTTAATVNYYELLKQQMSTVVSKSYGAIGTQPQQDQVRLKECPLFQTAQDLVDANRAFQRTLFAQK